MASFRKAAMLDNLRRQCSRREYCSADIRRKICDAYAKADSADSPREEALEEILATLKTEGYLSDRRYASAFARDKASLNGWGTVKISFALSAKGISKADIEAALEEIDSDSADKRLQKLLEAKFRTLKDDPQCKLKLMRFAVGRGYPYDSVAELVDALVRKCD